MEFKIDRDVLQVVLNKAAGTVSNKDVIPILKNFLIKVAGGRLRVMSTDLNLGAIAELPMNDPQSGASNITTEGSIAAPAKKLLDIANSAPAGFIHVKIEGLIMTLRGGFRDVDENGKKLEEVKHKALWVIHCMDVATFPDFPDYDAQVAVSVPREVFLQALDQVSFAAARNELKVNLMAVHVNGGFIYAADGHRACRRKFESQNPVNNFTIPHGAVALLVNLLKQATSSDAMLCQTKNHLLFKIGDDLYHARKLEQQFPDIEGRVIKLTEGYSNELKIPCVALLESIKRAQITSEDNRLLTLRLEKNPGHTKLTLVTINNVEDRFEETLDGPTLSWSGSEGFERSINWEYLQDVLDVMQDDTVTIKIGEDKGLNKSMYRFEEGQLVAVVLPVRIRKDEKGNDQNVNKRIAAHVDAQEAKNLTEGAAP